MLPTASSSLRGSEALAPPLPRPRPPLIGRAREVATLVAWLRRPAAALVTLTGAGGVGKTRLALEAAARLVDRFASGVCFVSLAPVRDPALVPATVARALGLREVPGSPPLDTLCAVLRDRPLLLVLDNFEQVLPAGPDLARLAAACPELTILVTSREALRLSGERVFPVPPLALAPPGGASPAVLARSPAVALYLERARAVRPELVASEDTLRATAAICARLDGLPLAIELAAARSTTLAPPALLRRLRGRLDLLTRGANDAPDRHRTMRAAIGWSYDLLPAREQALFGRLAVFAGGASLDAVEAVCGPAARPDGLLDDVTALVEKSLLQVDPAAGEPPRFRMLETVREFALERLAAAGDGSAMRARHAAHYLALARTAGPEMRGRHMAAWLDRLERDHDNLRAALDWDAGDPAQAEAALWAGAALAHLWLVRGHVREGRQRLASLLARPAARAATRGRARALCAAGRLALWQGGDDAAAADLLEEARALARGLGDDRTTADALRLLGELAQRRGDGAGARVRFEESLALARGVGDAVGVRWSLEDLGDLAAEGDAGAAVPYYERALALAQAAGDQHSTAALLRSVGELAHAQGDQARAAATLRESLALSRALDDRTCGALCLDALARVLGAQGRPAHAATVFAAAGALREASGMTVPAAHRAVYDGWVDAARGASDAAAFDRAWVAGRALDFAQAIAFALADDASPRAATAPARPGGRGRPAPGPRDATAGPLTPREREVALLVARGLTSREIATALVVTERTAETHVEHILAKLGFRARAQIGVWVGERGLLAAAGAGRATLPPSAGQGQPPVAAAPEACSGRRRGT